MKKTVIILSILALIASSCRQSNTKKQADTNEKTEPILMTMTLTTIAEWTGTNYSGALRQWRGFDLNGTGTAVINWGDGTPNDTITFKDDEYFTGRSHAYTDSISYNITVTGEDVTFLHCCSNEKNFTAIDVSNNTALKKLICSLNDYYDYDYQKELYLGGNPGTSSCNWRIAADKEWVVYK